MFNGTLNTTVGSEQDYGMDPLILGVKIAAGVAGGLIAIGSFATWYFCCRAPRRGLQNDGTQMTNIKPANATPLLQAVIASDGSAANYAAGTANPSTYHI
ncbi:MAG: hypothetical protein K0R66_902 [Gammaproteobacteria bacterium]|jgi:hypothetical protein|nr:hypothetical protein [Gammaproteobacteria bacterium]